jgi:hypothetical protein
MIDVLMNVLIDTPKHWLSIEPPEGLTLVAIEPGDPTTYRPNLVVTASPRPRDTNGLLPITEALVDSYLNDVVSGLGSILDEFEFGDAWLLDPPTHQRATQRIIGRYAAGYAPVEIVQQHAWFDEIIVVATATVPADCSNGMAAVLGRCLSSVQLRS